jgi:hypothetical protein
MLLDVRRLTVTDQGRTNAVAAPYHLIQERGLCVQGASSTQVQLLGAGCETESYSHDMCVVCVPAGVLVHC